MNTENTYCLADLETTEFRGTPLAVIGHPIKHSISPAMHNAALAKLSKIETRFNDWAYYRFDIPPEQLAQALELFHKRKFRGLNLTIPHKVQVLDLIEEISPAARSMGAVNTLLWKASGYFGHNTDGYGLAKGLEWDFDISPQAVSLMILGSGGAARAAAVQALLSGCKHLYVGNRSADRLQDLIKVLETVSGDAQVQTFALNELPKNLLGRGVVINATALGLKPSDPAPIDVNGLPAQWKVYDMIYNPPATTFLQQAKARGLKTANGLSMLVHQGARALEIWTESDQVDAEAMMLAARNALQV